MNTELKETATVEERPQEGLSSAKSSGTETLVGKEDKKEVTPKPKLDVFKTVDKTLKFLGLGFLITIAELFVASKREAAAKKLFYGLLLPVLGMVIFLGIWSWGASYLYQKELDYKIENALKSGGEEAKKTLLANLKSGDEKIVTLPKPSEVYTAMGVMYDDVLQVMDDKVAFNKKVAALNEKRVAEGKDPITYTGRPSILDQVFTSLNTVLIGLLIACLIAIPVGILLGLSKALSSMFNWLIQVLRPVSPVVWLLLVSMIVKSAIKDPDANLAYIISFISVAFCAMWATLINARLGVSSVDQDFVNVGKVLKLGVGKRIFKIVLPASIPLIFTGIRITVSVSWMVLIAIELLAQSPGLGSFVWEEFQGGSTESNSKIIVAMFLIGLIGFMLDKVMQIIQTAVEEGKIASAFKFILKTLKLA